jgi:orotate phosphoribosyltransferase-like protein
MAALAAELGAELLPVPEILKRFDMSADTLRHLLKKDAQFRSMIKDFKREWNSPMSAKDRIKLKALLMVEDNLMELHRIFNNMDLNPTARMDAFKMMTELSDAKPKKEAPDGAKFSLTLNLGPHATEPYEISAEAKTYLEAGDQNE